MDGCEAEVAGICNLNELEMPCKSVVKAEGRNEAYIELMIKNTRW